MHIVKDVCSLFLVFMGGGLGLAGPMILGALFYGKAGAIVGIFPGLFLALLIIAFMTEWFLARIAN